MIEMCWGKWIRRRFYVLRKYIPTFPPEVSIYLDMDVIDDIDELGERL
jgi:hypothetical protein